MAINTSKAQCIFQQPSRCGRITVLENAKFRWLEFGDGIVQSAYCRANPNTLVLDYTQWMLSALLLLKQRPRLALLLGLGGGSLVQPFNANQVPIDMVEYDPVVIEVCQRFFPTDVCESKVQNVDARDCWTHLEGAYDLALIDLFGHGGAPAWLAAPAFYDSCRASLSDVGVLAVNLHTCDSITLEHTLSALDRAFEGRILTLRVPAHDNLIVLATANSAMLPNRRELHQRATTLSADWPAPWMQISRALVAKYLARGQLTFARRYR
jgi:spermidine synthase